MNQNALATIERAAEPAIRPWWEDAVIYHVYPRSFQDSDGDGIGDLPGLRSRLGYIDWLGADAVWLSPVYRSPMRDFGYDVADHTAVDPVFGRLEDIDDIIADAHLYGLRVLLDFIPNHTSDEHAWFAEARERRDAARRDWYVWRDPAPDGGPPNNWISVFGGPAWTLDERTGQYYLHSFLPQQPDLNWRNPEVERAMFDVLRFWLDRGVDGFRFDAAEHVLKDPLLRDNPPSNIERPKREYALQEHIHDRAQPDAHDLYRRVRRLLDGTEGAPRVALAEILAHPKPDQLEYWASFYGEQLDELHLPLNLALTTLPWDARRVHRGDRGGGGSAARGSVADARVRQPRRAAGREPLRRARRARDPVPAVHAARHADPLQRRRAGAAQLARRRGGRARSAGAGAARAQPRPRAARRWPGCAGCTPGSPCPTPRRGSPPPATPAR